MEYTVFFIEVIDSYIDEPITKADIENTFGTVSIVK